MIPILCKRNFVTMVAVVHLLLNNRSSWLCVQSVPHFHSQINCHSNEWVSHMSSIILKVLFGRFNYCIWMFM